MPVQDFNISAQQWYMVEQLEETCFKIQLALTAGINRLYVPTGACKGIDRRPKPRCQGARSTLYGHRTAPLGQKRTAFLGQANISRRKNRGGYRCEESVYIVPYVTFNSAIN